MTDRAFAGYRGQLFYDLCKSTAIRLAYAMSVELADTSVTAFALTPGFLRSEAVLDHFGVTEDNWREAIGQDRYFAHSETPLLVGRVIAALAADPRVATRTGQALTCWDLAREYGITDVDGAQPHWDEHLDDALAEILAGDSPSEDDLCFLKMRRPQLDFDASRAELRTQLTGFLEAHTPP